MYDVKAQFSTAPDSLLNSECLTQLPSGIRFAQLFAEAVRSADPSELAANCDQAHVYIVGGWCRDMIMKRGSDDVDLEIFGIAPPQLQNLLKSVSHYQVIQPPDNKIAPFKVLLEHGESVDVLTPFIERDASSSQAGGFVSAPELTVSEAATRRDFTCNAIYFDPIGKTYLDPMGGIKDIEARQLRLVPGLTPDTINAGIPLRACRMVAELNFELEERSKIILKDAVTQGVLDDIDKTLLTREFLKMLLRSRQPSLALRAADELGILQVILPELAKLKIVPQDLRHHPEGSAFNHTMLVVDAAARLSEGMDIRERIKVMLGALLHDIGKSVTTRRVQIGETSEEKVTHYNHEIDGVQIAKGIFKRLDIGSDISSQVLKIVRNHMRPLELQMRFGDSNSAPSFDNQVRQIVRNIHPLKVQTFLAVCLADRQGRGHPENQKEASTAIVRSIEESVARNGFDRAPLARLMSRNDLVELGFEDKGTTYQDIIRYIESRRDAGHISEKQQAKNNALYRFSLSKEDIEESGILHPTLKSIFYQDFRTQIKAGTIATVSASQEFMNQFSRGNFT